MSERAARAGAIANLGSASVRRLFVLDGPDEIEIMREIIRLHLNQKKIEVRYVTVDELSKCGHFHGKPEYSFNLMARVCRGT
jgi:hypothetical protein